MCVFSPFHWLVYCVAAAAPSFHMEMKKHKRIAFIRILYTFTFNTRTRRRMGDDTGNCCVRFSLKFNRNGEVFWKNSPRKFSYIFKQIYGWTVKLHVFNIDIILMSKSDCLGIKQFGFNDCHCHVHSFAHVLSLFLWVMPKPSACARYACEYMDICACACECVCVHMVAMSLWVIAVLAL